MADVRVLLACVLASGLAVASCHGGHGPADSSTAGDGGGTGVMLVVSDAGSDAQCPAHVTCQDQGFDCGTASDGCNGTLSCGACSAGENCGATAPNVCGTYVCTPQSCLAQNLDCGMAGDTCGNALDCGTCSGNLSCGGGGTPNVCGTTCMPTTCAALGADCGAVADGCGGLLMCGTCAGNQLCGAVAANV